MTDVNTTVSHAKEVYELLDSFIKIGLGALIAGGFSYLAINRNHKNNILKEKLDYKMAMLQDANILFTKYIEKSMQIIDFHYAAAYDNKKTLNCLKYEDKQLLKQYNDEYANNALTLNNLKSKLYFLEAKKAINITAEYQSKFNDFRKDFLNRNNEFASIDEISKILNTLKYFEEIFYDEIRNCFGKLK